MQVECQFSVNYLDVNVNPCFEGNLPQRAEEADEESTFKIKLVSLEQSVFKMQSQQCDTYASLKRGTEKQLAFYN